MNPPPRHDAVVVDTSLAIKWFLREDLSDEARELLAAWDQQRRRCFVPSWFACEVSNVLYKNVLRGRIVVLDAQGLMHQLLEAVTVRDFEPATSARAIEIALQLGQQASYDAQYLAQAEHLDCELWTADQRFWNAAKSAFPQIRWVGEISNGAVRSGGAAGDG
ncbi:MAG: type II toxin-antitoxin system VapC family toxin [Thermomicrobiales bacterium]